MTIEAKFTTAGMTKGEKYDVIEDNKSINVQSAKNYILLDKNGNAIVDQNGECMDLYCP